MASIVTHFKRGTFEEKYWLPEHDKRRESSLFKKNKKFIRDECGLPCWVCSAREDLEVHHVFEWSLWNAMDRKKVTDILNAIEFYDEDYIFQADQPEKLQAALKDTTTKNRYLKTPDDIRNLVVFCRTHHRLKYTGIHTISFPIWLTMAAVASDGILTREQILEAMARVQALDEELARFAANNYKPV